MKNIDIIGRIKSFATTNDLKMPEKFEFWKVGTSWTSMLKKFQEIKNNNFDVFKCKGAKKSKEENAGDKYVIYGLEKELAINTIKQHFVAGIVFNVFEDSFALSQKSRKDMFKEWVLDMSGIKFNKNFIESTSIKHFIRNNKEQIIDLWKNISNDEDSYMRNEVWDIFFSLYTYEVMMHEEDKQSIIKNISDKLQKTHDVSLEQNIIKHCKAHMIDLEFFEIIIGGSYE